MLRLVDLCVAVYTSRLTCQPKAKLIVAKYFSYQESCFVLFMNYPIHCVRRLWAACYTD